MSRSGYSDIDGWELVKWRGAVASAIKGQRGQSFLKEMIEALDAMPDKRLIEESLAVDGDVCAMGSVGQKRGIDMTDIDFNDREEVANLFGISGALAAEISYENDEGGWRETPEQRWARMRRWAEKQLIAKRESGQ